ncbi:33 kDa inner dynein arm light chain, axonemal-like [Convolutriloba macropyga]|uniref:33 kDa inner dynein arm light chain, axonemal-like n=1 Tax=Convolutriloba macropyga TaxID=536237 RepID=UPI003F528DA9
MSSGGPKPSLIRYSDPVIVSRNPDKRTPGARKLIKEQEITTMSPSQVVNKQHGSDTTGSEHGAQTVEETLNTILPPKQWMEEGQMFIQQVKSSPATRHEVADLSVELSDLLVNRQAREQGICPIRRELFNEVFDELIRQITIDGVERGLLLLRIRDEINMTFKAYQTLYESSVAFGTRKAIIADSGKVEQDAVISKLELEKRELEKQFNELKSESENIEKREQERRGVDEKKRQEEIQFLKRTNQQLKQQVDGISNKTK